MARHSIADDLVTLPRAHPRPQRRAMRLYLFYRFVLALGLLITFLGGLGPPSLGASAPRLHLVVLVFYLLFTLVSLLLSLFEREAVEAEYLFALGVDILALTTLLYTSGGANSGFGILLGISIAFAAQGLPAATALTAAGVAALAVLFEIWIEYSFHHTRPPWFSAALLGGSYLALALLSVELAHRARASEQLIRQQDQDITNLTELNEHIIQQMQTGVLVLDGNDRIKMLNDAAWSFLGRPISAEGIELTEISPPLAKVVKAWRRHPDARQRHLHAQHQGTNLLVRCQQPGSGGSEVLVFIEDASHAAAAAQQMKLASLGRLAASIAHEIRNPLGAIGHANQLLRESPDLTPADRHMTEIIDRNTARLNDVIENILALSRRQEPHPETIPLRPWLEQVRQELIESLELPPERVQVQVAPAEARLRFDRRQIQQVLTVLVENAVRHQQALGDRLQVILAGGVDELSGEGHLEVIDNGRPIPAEIVERIFDPFFTTLNTGTGLGLYLAKELCDANDIRISYLPVAAGGNCFKLRLHPNMVV